MTHAELFQKIDWRVDRFILNGYTYMLQHGASQSTSNKAFYFYKQRTQVEQYQRFFTETGFEPKSVLELGIWDGGSAAFWTETLALDRYAAIDLQNRGDSPYFVGWLAERSDGRVRTHWGISQTDAHALSDVLKQSDITTLDLVIDDCSHMPGPTLASFEILFARVRVGGYYIIEDWAWALQPKFADRKHPWGVNPPLHPIVHKLVELHGSRPDLITSVKVYADFVAIERGPGAAPYRSWVGETQHRPRPWARLVVKHLRATAGRIRRAL